MLKIFLLLASTSTFAAEGSPWFRNAGEYIAFRTVRPGLATDTGTKLITDGKRFDPSIGKRVSLLSWDEEGPATAWSFGIDGGMLASLQRYKRNGQLTFATNTFDGYFGLYFARAWKGWIAMIRYAHLSAHLVDNSPQFLNPVSYNQFWPELIVSKTFPSPEKSSDWEIHLQGNVGMNHTSLPKARQPRAGFSVQAGKEFNGKDSLAALVSADALRAGVNGQRPSYSFFAGIGRLTRANSTRRPFRVGVAHFTGSDYRNQLFYQKQEWTTFVLGLDF